MKRFFSLAVAVAALAIGAPTLKAETKHTWTGFYGGVHGGMDLTSTEASLGGLGIDSLAGNGVGYGAHGGADLQIPRTPIVIGIMADHTWSDARFAVTPGVLSADLDKSWSVAGRVGYAFDGALIYALGGYTEADVSAKLLGTSIGSTKLEGWLAGGGVEIMLAHGVSLAGEYRYTKFDGLNFGGVGGLDLDTERHEVRAALRYRFNPF